MKFSVVIPMFNAERTIVRALESVERQTARESIVEIIVVDDGSIDKGRNLVELYSKRPNQIGIRVIQQQNSGVARARNVGIKNSVGEWISLLDADDEWLPNKLELQINILKKHKEIDFLGCEINDFPVNLYFKRLTSLTKITIPLLLIKTFPQTSTLIFNRRVFYKIGGFDESMTHGEDGRFIMDSVSFFNCYYLPVKLVEYDGGKEGIGSAGLSSNIFAMREAEKHNLKYVLEKKHIGYLTYCFASAFAYARFIRRLVRWHVK